MDTDSFIIQKALENGDVNKRDSTSQKDDSTASSSKTAETTTAGKVTFFLNSHCFFCLTQKCSLGTNSFHVEICNSLPAGKYCMLFCCLLIFFSKSTFLKNSFRNTLRISNSLDPDQGQHFVGPDLVLNCLQRLSADDTSM